MQNKSRDWLLLVSGPQHSKTCSKVGKNHAQMGSWANFSEQTTHFSFVEEVGLQMFVQRIGDQKTCTTKVNAELMSTLHLSASLDRAHGAFAATVTAEHTSATGSKSRNYIGPECCITARDGSPEQLRAKHELLLFSCPAFAVQCSSSFTWKPNIYPFSSIKTNILFSSLTAHVRHSLTHLPSQKRLYWNQGLADSTTISPNPRFCQLLVVLWSKWICFSHTASIILWIPSPWTKIRRAWTTNSQNLFADQKIKITQILKRLKAAQKLCHVLTCRSQNKYQCTLWPA